MEKTTNELIMAVQKARQKGFTNREILKIVLEEIGITYQMSRIQISEKELMLQITKVMAEFGMPAYLAGSSYIKEGIFFAIKQENCSLKDILNCIANKYKLTPAGAGKSMHNVTKKTWKSLDENVYKKYFGYSSNKSLTPSEFIMGIAQYFRINYDVDWLQERSQL